MVSHAIVVYVSGQLLLLHVLYFNALTVPIFYLILRRFYVLMLYTCLSENSSDELML